MEAIDVQALRRPENDCVFSKNVYRSLVYNKFTKEEAKKLFDIVEIDYIGSSSTRS